MKKIALVGNPNSGKTTLYNSLTGSTAHVGNWAGVTVDKTAGVYKVGKEKRANIVDLPGIYSLSPYTNEEVIARNYIIDSAPDCIINIVDSTNLERNLYLTTQLMEVGIPIVIALNMTDALEANGDKIDVDKLSEELGLVVVKISALKEQGIDELMMMVLEAAETKREASSVLFESSLKTLVEQIENKLIEEKADNPLFHAIKLIEKDMVEIENHKDLSQLVEEHKEGYSHELFGTDFEAFVANERYVYIETHYAKALTRKIKGLKISRSDKIDRVMTHKIFGLPIFLMVLFAMFHLTFSENLFYLGGILGEDFTTFSGTFFEGVLGSGGINSPGVILSNLMGLLTDTISGSVVSLVDGTPIWVNAFIMDGVLAGVFGVLGFVPQILFLLLLFSIMEDSGYMARVAFILDRVLRKFGVSGRAFMPMIMGFGCSIPAITNTRTLSDEKEKIATIRVIPFFSCGAKLPILTAIAGGIVMQFGIGNADLITYAMYVLGVATAIISIIVMKSTTMRGEAPPFIMELPSYHCPQAKNLMLHLWDKAKHFIVKAFTIVLASTIVIWFISHFTWGMEFLSPTEIDSSILASIGKILQPLFTTMGFGSQLTDFGWVFIVAAITGLIAKENVVATFGTLAASISVFVAGEGSEAVAVLISATGITIPALLAFIAFNMMTIPCFAAVATARGELTRKQFYMTLLFWIAVSFIIGTVVYTVGTWWWFALIYLAVIVTLFIIFKVVMKKKIHN